MDENSITLRVVDGDPLYYCDGVPTVRRYMDNDLIQVGGNSLTLDEAKALRRMLQLAIEA